MQIMKSRTKARYLFVPVNLICALKADVKNTNNGKQKAVTKKLLWKEKKSLLNEQSRWKNGVFFSNRSTRRKDQFYSLKIHVLYS